MSLVILVPVGIVLGLVTIQIGNTFFPGSTEIPVKVGIDSDNTDETVGVAENESTSDNSESVFDNINWVKVVDKFIFFVLIVLLIYFSTTSWEGGFMRMLAGFFPREFKTLGLDKLIAENVVHHGNEPSSVSRFGGSIGDSRSTGSGVGAEL